MISNLCCFEYCLHIHSNLLCKFPKFYLFCECFAIINTVMSTGVLLRTCGRSRGENDNTNVVVYGSVALFKTSTLVVSLAHNCNAIWNFCCAY